MIGRAVAVIGAGAVGGAVATALGNDRAARQVLIVDQNRELAEAEAKDLQDGVGLGSPVSFTLGEIGEAARADVVVLCAGKGGGPDDSRMKLQETNAAVVREVIGGLRSEGFDGVLIVVTNPADVMAELAAREIGLAPSRTIGSGTLLDSLRLRRMLGEMTGVAATSIEAAVIGEHGDSSVSVLSNARVGGVPLTRFGDFDRRQIQDAVRRRAPEIIAGKGDTSRGIGAAVARIARAVLRDERVVLPVGARLRGEYGSEKKDEGSVFFGTPCEIGAEGILRVFEVEMDDKERADAAASLATLIEACRRL